METQNKTNKINNSYAIIFFDKCFYKDLTQEEKDFIKERKKEGITIKKLRSGL